jgi:hypothetical protein
MKKAPPYNIKKNSKDKNACTEKVMFNRVIHGRTKAFFWLKR